MTDLVWEIAAGAVLVVQLVAPLGVGAWIYHTDTAPPAKSAEGDAGTKRLTRKARRTAKNAPREPTPRPPAVVPIHCAACQGPVPLTAGRLACPACHTEVPPPADYGKLLRLRRVAERQLLRAERVWRWSRWSSARPTVALLRAAVVGWSAAVIAACVVCGQVGWPGVLLALAGILAIVQIFVGLAYVSVLADGRQRLPPVPRARLRRAPPETASCQDCGAACAFAEDHLVATCPYCGADNYRAALAQRAKHHAAAEAQRAHASLLDAVRALDHDKTEALTLFAFMAIAEVFYAIIFTAVWIFD